MLVRVVRDPFHGVRVRVRPDGLLFFRITLLDCTLSQVLGIGHMRDRKVVGGRVLKGIGNLRPSPNGCFPAVGPVLLPASPSSRYSNSNDDVRPSTELDPAASHIAEFNGFNGHGVDDAANQQDRSAPLCVFSTGRRCAQPLFIVDFDGDVLAWLVLRPAICSDSHGSVPAKSRSTSAA